MTAPQSLQQTKLPFPMSQPFSLLLPVYHGDGAQEFLRAVRSSTVEQTLPPSEVVIVVDGPVGEELNMALSTVEREVTGVKIVRLKENGGLGPALAEGMRHTTLPLVARMDADDVSLPRRFELQIAYMEQHPELAVVGGQIEEFIGEESHTVGRRIVPLAAADCRRYYRDRDPLNHMSVVLHREAVMRAGNYQAWHLDEDSYLWGRLLLIGCEVGNIAQVVVRVRVGEAMYARRGGWHYFQSDMSMLAWKLRKGLTTRTVYAKNWLVRFVVYVVLPNSLRGWVFKHLLRKEQ